VGACTARNQAIGLCRGAEIAFLDNDIVLRDRRWLQVLRDTLCSDDRIALVTPKLLFPFPPYNIEHVGIAISPNGRVGYPGRNAPHDDPAYTTRRELQGAASACILVKRGVLDEVGGFDDVYNPVQFEDLDLEYRMKARGYTLVYEPAVEMYHFENVTTDNTPGLNFKYQTVKNLLEFTRRYQSVFAHEGGPADDQLVWEDLPRRRIEEIGELEVRE